MSGASIIAKMSMSLKHKYIKQDHIAGIRHIIWTTSRENLSSGFPTKRVSNQSAQLQRLASKLKFLL